VLRTGVAANKYKKQTANMPSAKEKSESFVIENKHTLRHGAAVKNFFKQTAKCHLQKKIASDLL